MVVRGQFTVGSWIVACVDECSDVQIADVMKATKDCMDTFLKGRKVDRSEGCIEERGVSPSVPSRCNGDEKDGFGWQRCGFGDVEMGEYLMGKVGEVGLAEGDTADILRA